MSALESEWGGEEGQTGRVLVCEGGGWRVEGGGCDKVSETTYINTTCTHRQLPPLAHSPVSSFILRSKGRDSKSGES